jgi:hypothetical protein
LFAGVKACVAGVLTPEAFAVVLALPVFGGGVGGGVALV